MSRVCPRETPFYVDDFDILPVPLPARPRSFTIIRKNTWGGLRNVDRRICPWFKTVERILPCQGGKSIESFRMGKGTIQDIATIRKLGTGFMS